MGYALAFDGVDDSVSVAPHPALDLTTGTIEFWVKPGNLVGNACLLANRGYTGAQTRFSVHLSTNAIGLFDGTALRTVPFNTVAGQWYHVALVCTGGDTEVFVDGISRGFTGNGFNKNLPTGESALSDMKQYISTSAGLNYTVRSEYSNFDFGVSAFHLNKPKQTFLQDEKQVLPIRYVAHSNYELFLNDYLVLNTNGVYMKQTSASYFSVGGGVGRYIDEEGKTMINAGMWYWSKNALVPYVGFTYGNFQAGFSYDIAISKLNDAPVRPRTWELSLIIRGAKNDKPSGIIPCPWK